MTEQRVRTPEEDEELALCKQDLRDAEEKAEMARARIAYLRGEGPWFDKPPSPINPDVDYFAKLLAGPDADAATVALAERLAAIACDVTHENGTPEGTRAAVFGTLRDAVTTFAAQLQPARVELLAEAEARVLCLRTTSDTARLRALERWLRSALYEASVWVERLDHDQANAFKTMARDPDPFGHQHPLPPSPIFVRVYHDGADKTVARIFARREGDYVAIGTVCGLPGEIAALVERTASKP